MALGLNFSKDFTPSPGQAEEINLDLFSRRLKNRGIWLEGESRRRKRGEDNEAKKGERGEMWKTRAEIQK